MHSVQFGAEDNGPKTVVWAAFAALYVFEPIPQGIARELDVSPPRLVQLHASLFVMSWVVDFPCAFRHWTVSSPSWVSLVTLRVCLQRRFHVFP
jgi:hypothetical protein